MTTNETESLAAARKRGAAVAAAVNDGRIQEHSVPRWMSAFRRDPDGTARVLASLSSPGVPRGPVSQPPAAPIPAAYRDAPRSMATNAHGEATYEQVLVGGKPYDSWSEQEKNDAVSWMLGPRFRRGLKPPPEPQWYIPPIPGSGADGRNAWRGSSWGQQ